jgi:hypothetical protein
VSYQEALLRILVEAISNERTGSRPSSFELDLKS